MLSLLFVFALIVWIVSVFFGNDDHNLPNRPIQTQPHGGYTGYDFDREYYRYRREREFQRLVATLIFIVLMVIILAILVHIK